MSYEKILQMIEERLDTLWNDQTPIAWDNKEFIPVAGQEFIRLTVDQTLSTLTAMNNYREHGLITVQVFTQRNKGVRENAVIADKVSDIFRGWSQDRLYVGESRVNRVGQTKEWYQSNVLVDFYYDNCIH